MSEANHIPDSGQKVATNGDWVAELEAALTHAERAMAGAMKALDFEITE